ncbi:hypothetical protein Dimus_020523 [Dionaea muscipula]
MAAAMGFASIGNPIFSCRRYHHLLLHRYRANHRVPSTNASFGAPIGLRWDKRLEFAVPFRADTRVSFKSFNSIQLDRVLTTGDEEEIGDGFFEAIEALEQMTREPSDVLGEMNSRLSARELQLVLVYFSQEGRDSWCALEVFEWLKKENRVDKETMELMVSIMCGWVKKLIETEHDAGGVLDLLVDMECVGLKPNFSMMEKVISLYWESGKKERAVGFVEEVLRRGIAHSKGDGDGDGDDGHRGGPAGYLAWKMMEEGNYREAVKLVIQLRESGLRPEMYSYLIAMTALVKESNEVSKAFRKVKGFAKAGLVAGLDEGNVGLIEKYQSDLLADGIRLSSWVVQEGTASLYGLVHEKLLALYICAGRGLEAERLLWELKLIGKEVDRYFYDTALAICASQGESAAVLRLLTTLEASSSVRKKKTLSWLLRGYVKGENFVDAANAITRMLRAGLYPDYLDRVAVLQGLRKRIQQSGNLEAYLMLCKCLSDAELVGPCLVYMYLRQHKLWIVKMV